MTYYSSKVAQLTEELYKNRDQTERAIRAKSFIDQHFHKPISLDSIACAVYCSKYHLNREFKRHYGITPSQYIRDRRIYEAKKLLKGSASVTDACYSVGYESISSFSILFRRWTGSNPGDMKKARMNK